jgi:transcriptional regulator of acetoin/glycerol metabolism
LDNKKASSITRSSTASWQEERENLINALRRFKGNQSETARVLGVSRVTIWKRIKKYEIDLAADLSRNKG